MSSSIHHIQFTRYNRRLQYTPMDRVGNRNKAILKYLTGKISTGFNQYDNRSYVERKASRKRRKDAATFTILISIIAGALSFFIVLDLIFAVY